MGNRKSIKKWTHKQSASLVLSLLLIGVGVACFVWVRKEKRQYTLNRNLIEALSNLDTKQALVLVEAGADPNTRAEPAPVPTLPTLIKQLLHPSPPQTSTSPTAFLIACEAWFSLPQRSNTPFYVNLPLDPQLTEAMLLHGAKVNAKDRYGWTALRRLVISALFGPAISYNKNKGVIKQLLANGADPDDADPAFPDVLGITPMQSALAIATTGAHSHPDMVVLLRKYRKHP